ncbi:MAG: SDR family oxidoreductase [Caulobacter sp.]|nr:SDR family oxidoreductase [Caulobacter sp.]
MAKPDRLADKVAIVTGAAGGIGRAICLRLAKEGAAVLVTGPHLERAEAVAAELLREPGTRAAGTICDVRDPASVAAAVRQAKETWGSLDLVNNAGVMIFKPLEEISDEEWRTVLDIDLLGAVRLTREAFRAMRPGGAIVNVASVHAFETTPLVAIEGKPKGLRANAVVPGAVDTAMLRDNPDLKSGAERLDPADVGCPEDVASAVAFLCSDDAAFVTGAALAVDGGRLARL